MTFGQFFFLVVSTFVTNVKYVLNLDGMKMTAWRYDDGNVSDGTNGGKFFNVFLTLSLCINGNNF